MNEQESEANLKTTFPICIFLNNEEHDRLLIERIKKKDHTAFRQLIDKYKDDALSLACAILKDQTDAEDVLQDTFIKVYSRIKSFKYQSAFYTWLYRIVVNNCYNALRKSGVNQVELQDYDTSENDLSKASDQKDRRFIINAALNLMKVDEALVLRLFYLSELKMEEVVEVTGFTMSKVKVTLHRARKSLANILKKKFKREIEEL